MIQLRPYQQHCIDRIRQAYRERANSPLLVAPTGSGKTIMFAYITHGAMNLHKRVAILAHRVELIDQISKALTDFQVPHAFIAAGYEYRRHLPVYVCSVFTLAKRLDWIDPDLVVVDEAHHCVASTTWGKILAAYPRARRLGVTATPVRLSGEGLADCFDLLIEGPTAQELIDLGHLSPLRVFAPPTVKTEELHTRAGEFMRGELIDLMDKPTITGSAVEHYQRLTPGKQAVVFCVSVEHAKHVAKDFTTAGISAEAVDGKTDPETRRHAIGAFRRGDTRVLTSCDLVSEGFDVPNIEVGISLRPTHSLGLWLQQCGRILRPAPGKREAVLLDHAGNTLRHGLPTESRRWSLLGVEKCGDARQPAGSIRVCPMCFSAQESRLRTCRNCSYEFPVESRSVGKKDGSLEEITPAQIEAARHRREQGITGNTGTFEERVNALAQLGRMRNPNMRDPFGWAKHVLAARDKKRRAQA